MLENPHTYTIGTGSNSEPFSSKGRTAFPNYRINVKKLLTNPELYGIMIMDY